MYATGVGRIVGVSLGNERGQGKTNAGHANLLEGWGVEGDAHGGSERQVSILMAESMRRKAMEMGVEIRPGDFAENLTTEGIELGCIPIGTLISVGDALLRARGVGRPLAEGHTFSFHGEALLVSEGVFCDVVRGGAVRIGDEVRVVVA